MRSFCDFNLKLHQENRPLRNYGRERPVEGECKSAARNRDLAPKVTFCTDFSNRRFRQSCDCAGEMSVLNLESRK